MNNKLLSFLLVLIFLFVSLNLCYAQDPGIPDTVRFELWGTYVPCPPCSGIAVVPLVVFNDEELLGITIPLKLSDPVTFDSGKFVVQIVEFLEDTLTYGDFLGGEDGKDVLIAVGTLGSNIPTGYGIFAHLFLTVSDTGFATIDKTSLPPDFTFHFLDPEDMWIIPVFLKSEFYIGAQGVLPGDVNNTGIVDLGDVIYLARYLLKGGPSPVFLGSADVNTDCQINLADVIYLAYYVLMGGPHPHPGCAWG